MVRSQEEPSSIWATSGQFRSTCEARICTMMSFSCITAFSRPGLDLRHGNYRGSPSIQGHGGHTLCIQGDFLAGKRGFTRVHWHKRPRSCWCSLTPKACSRSRHCGTMLIPGRDDRPRHAFGNGNATEPGYCSVLGRESRESRGGRGASNTYRMSSSSRRCNAALADSVPDALQQTVPLRQPVQRVVGFAH